jgi:hypothetical protein
MEYLKGGIVDGDTYHKAPYPTRANGAVVYLFFKAGVR